MEADLALAVLRPLLLFACGLGLTLASAQTVTEVGTVVSPDSAAALDSTVLDSLKTAREVQVDSAAVAALGDTPDLAALRDADARTEAVPNPTATDAADVVPPPEELPDAPLPPWLYADPAHLGTDTDDPVGDDSATYEPADDNTEAGHTDRA